MKRITMTAIAALGLGVMPALAVNEVESRAYYSTNPGDCVGKYVSNFALGGAAKWSDDMMIATCGANDMATAWKGSHENNVLDTYALYAAWDDANLYIAWQMVNTGDTWAREGDGPLTDYGHIGDVPLIVALSIDPTSNPTMTGKLENGNFIWSETSGNGVTYTSHVDHLFYMSGKVGSGTPAMFTGNAQGLTNYGANCKPFSSIGVSYQMEHAFAPSHLWRQRETAKWSTPTTLVSDPEILNSIYDAECYDNLKAGPVSGLKAHSHEFDSFYEIKIPFAALGITREWLEANGIGCRVIATRGESGIDCIPFDPAMVDNVFEPYGKDPSTTHEKDDIDDITYALASIGKIRDINNITPPEPGPDPDPTPEPTPADGNYVIYFDNSNSNWNVVKTWIWDTADGNANYTGGTWPGADMKIDAATGYYFYSFTCEKESPKLKCLFNGGGDSNKTADLDLVNHGLYNAGGFIKVLESGVEDITLDNTEAVYFNMQGVRIAQPEAGRVYIKVTNGKAEKIMK
ncbi:MAG: starch-binding protein [Muribaculaceae bacterium]|nr:starch-binding protein [Muribaculaceae bacterium]